MDLVADVGQCRPDATFELGFACNHVGCRAAGNPTHGNHSRMQRVRFPRDQRLNCRDERACNDDRVCRLMGTRAMTAFALYFYVEAIRLRSHDAVADHDRAWLIIVRDMTAEYGDDVIQRSIRNRGSRSATGLFGRLKHEAHVARRRFFYEQRGGAEHHGHMCRVPARVHRIGVERRVRRFSELAARQRIHFGTQGNERFAWLDEQLRQNAMSLAPVAYG